MYFLGLDKRLKDYSNFFDECDDKCLGLGEFNRHYEPDDISKDLLQASWFVNNIFTLACKDWNLDEEEFLKETLSNGSRQGIHVEDLVRHASSVLKRPHIMVHMKAISFGYTSKLYDIPKRLWRTNERDC